MRLRGLHLLFWKSMKRAFDWLSAAENFWSMSSCEDEYDPYPRLADVSHSSGIKEEEDDSSASSNQSESADSEDEIEYEYVPAVEDNSDGSVSDQLVQDEADMAAMHRLV